MKEDTKKLNKTYMNSQEITGGKVMKELKEMAKIRRIPVLIKEDDIIEGWVQ